LPLLKTVQDVLSGIGADVIRLTGRSPGADIQTLGEAGVPTFGIIQDSRTYFNYHHSAADTLDKVDPAYLQQNAAAMAVLAYALADMAQPLPR
jgi:carboxypeptidase Q